MATCHDFRSDTVTKPNDQLLAALSPTGRGEGLREALGDDVMEEDSLTKDLEAYAAQLLGMESGLFVTSGTMGNLLAVLSHCQRGEQFLVGDKAHILKYEAGGSAMFGGVLPRAFPLTEHGTTELRDIERLIEPEDVHYCPTRLICLENTYNGYPLSPEYTASVATLARKHGLKLHIDGARIFNAAIALGCSPAKAVAGADSVSFCLSKGLAAPVGSILCGGKDFIKRARHLRKALGGGWRQSGVLAAMGLEAIKTNPKRLIDDHTLAKATADQLCLIPSLRVDLTHVKTNMVFAQLKKGDPAELAEFLAERGVKIYDDNPLRIVFHQDVDSASAEALVQGIRDYYAKP